MERLLKNVARFAMLLTRNPSTEDLLNSLMRDFLSRYSVSAIEIQVLGREGSMLIKSSVGQPIDGIEAKNVASLSQLVSHSNISGVSNADVLKAIVSLIASINKQIAALQKALLKKK